MKYTPDTSGAGFSFRHSPIPQKKKTEEERPEDIHRVFVMEGGIMREVGTNGRRVVPQIPKLRRF